MQDAENSPTLRQAKQWLDRYFAGEKPDVRGLPLASVGSDFRKEIWKILCEIPYGETIPYGGISQKLAALHGINVCLLKR